MITDPTHKHAGSSYLLIDSLPPDDQEPFSTWILRPTRPVIPTELDANGKPAACA